MEREKPAAFVDKQTEKSLEAAAAPLSLQKMTDLASALSCQRRRRRRRRRSRGGRFFALDSLPPPPRRQKRPKSLAFYSSLAEKFLQLSLSSLHKSNMNTTPSTLSSRRRERQQSKAMLVCAFGRFINKANNTRGTPAFAKEAAHVYLISEQSTVKW